MDQQFTIDVPDLDTLEKQEEISKNEEDATQEVLELMQNRKTKISLKDALLSLENSIAAPKEQEQSSPVPTEKKRNLPSWMLASSSNATTSTTATSNKEEKKKETKKRKLKNDSQADEASEEEPEEPISKKKKNPEQDKKLEKKQSYGDFTSCMKDVCICVSGIGDERKQLREKVTEMGGKYSHDFISSVTHLLVEKFDRNNLTDKIQKAIKNNTKIVDKQWLFDSFDNKKKMNDMRYEFKVRNDNDDDDDKRSDIDLNNMEDEDEAEVDDNQFDSSLIAQNDTQDLALDPNGEYVPPGEKANKTVLNHSQDSDEEMVGDIGEHPMLIIPKKDRKTGKTYNIQFDFRTRNVSTKNMPSRASHSKAEESDDDKPIKPKHPKANLKQSSTLQQTEKHEAKVSPHYDVLSQLLDQDMKKLHGQIEGDPKEFLLKEIAVWKELNDKEAYFENWSHAVAIPKSLRYCLKQSNEEEKQQLMTLLANTLKASSENVKAVQPQASSEEQRKGLASPAIAKQEYLSPVSKPTEDAFTFPYQNTLSNVFQNCKMYVYTSESSDSKKYKNAKRLIQALGAEEVHQIDHDTSHIVDVNPIILSDEQKEAIESEFPKVKIVTVEWLVKQFNKQHSK